MAEPTAFLNQLHTDGPSVYPFQIDWSNGTAVMVQMSPAEFERAAVLDQRAFSGRPQAQQVALADLSARAAALPDRPLGLVFHVGHCGSTLLSRLLGALPGGFGLREPLPFRDLAAAWAEREQPWALRSPGGCRQDQAWLRRIWARRPATAALSVVKATSFCSVLAADWLETFAGDAAVCLTVSPETYLASIFVHDGYMADIHGSARTRLCSALERFSAPPPAMHALAPGPRVALSYACDAINHAAALTWSPDRTRHVDFDAYLADPLERLSDLAAFFGLPASEAEVAAVLAGAIAGRYSKAEGYPFGSGERSARLAEARARRTADIREGLAWLDDFAGREPIVASALQTLGYR